MLTLFLVLVMFDGQTVESFVGGATVSDCYARIERYIESHSPIAGLTFKCVPA